MMALILAMLMVLVAQHTGEAWWWAWAFALLEAGVATVCVLHAIADSGSGRPLVGWWIAGVVSVVIGALDLLGLVRAEQAKPIA